MPESWSDRRPAQRRGPDSLEQGLDRLVSAGRQLVDGVSGARPGSRSSGRAGMPRLDGLGRWVENKLDWILEDEDDWREPWQQSRPRRRPLEAISRRQVDPRLPDPQRPVPRQPEPQQLAPQPSEPSAEPLEWPDDEAFTVPRWQRQLSVSQSPAAPPPPGRVVPRSTRRRPAG